MIKLGIDEATIIVLLQDRWQLKNCDWVDIALLIIEEVEKTLSLQMIFGERNPAAIGNINGYTDGFSYGNHPFYFRICFHKAYWRMGVAIKFSAQSWAYFRSVWLDGYGADVEIYDVLQDLTFHLKDYEVRLSRIDFDADYIDEGLSVDEIKKKLVSEELHFEFSTHKRNNSKIAYYTDDGVVNTLYIGSKKANVKTMVRIYNKRLEQIQQHGIHYEDAVKCKDWVRVENVIRYGYAHDITEQMMEMETREELVNLIATCILNKYTLVDSDGNEDKMTTLLRQCINEPSDYYYTDTKYKDMDLKSNLEYLVDRSGLMPFLYKITQFDDDALKMFDDYMADMVKAYSPKDVTKRWLIQHGAYYHTHGIKDLFGEKNNNSGNQIASGKEDSQSKTSM